MPTITGIGLNEVCFKNKIDCNKTCLGSGWKGALKNEVCLRMKLIVTKHVLVQLLVSEYSGQETNLHLTKGSAEHGDIVFYS